CDTTELQQARVGGRLHFLELGRRGAAPPYPPTCRAKNPSVRAQATRAAAGWYAPRVSLWNACPAPAYSWYSTGAPAARAASAKARAGSVVRASLATSARCASSGQRRSWARSGEGARP